MQFIVSHLLMYQTDLILEHKDYCLSKPHHSKKVCAIMGLSAIARLVNLEDKGFKNTNNGTH